MRKLFLIITTIIFTFTFNSVFGWNQYLWPLLMTTDPDMRTIVMAIDSMIPTGV